MSQCNKGRISSSTPQNHSICLEGSISRGQPNPSVTDLEFSCQYRHCPLPSRQKHIHGPRPVVKNTFRANAHPKYDAAVNRDGKRRSTRECGDAWFPGRDGPGRQPVSVTGLTTCLVNSQDRRDTTRQRYRTQLTPPDTAGIKPDTEMSGAAEHLLTASPKNSRQT